MSLLLSVADTVGLIALFAGACLCLASAIGINRLDDLYSRMHAATKPQVLGVLLVLLGIGLRLRDPFDVGMLFIIGIFQMLTIPAAAHLLARAHHRTSGAPRPRIVEAEGVRERGSPGTSHRSAHATLRAQSAADEQERP